METTSSLKHCCVIKNCKRLLKNLVLGVGINLTLCFVNYYEWFRSIAFIGNIYRFDDGEGGGSDVVKCLINYVSQ